MPTVSVIMPNRNMAHYAGFALSSIINQSMPVLEVLCIDCGSTDNSADVIARHPAACITKLIRHGVATPSQARNIALAQAQGEVIAFLDADDIWPEGKLQRQLGRLCSSPRVEMVSGYVCYFDQPSEDGTRPAAGSRTERLFHVHLGACLYRREFLDRLGHFDEELVYSEDVDLLLRVRESGEQFTILRSTELYYRQHPDSMMAQPDPRREQSLRIATHKSLVRRRRAGTLGIALREFSSYLEPE